MLHLCAESSEAPAQPSQDDVEGAWTSWRSNFADNSKEWNILRQGSAHLKLSSLKRAASNWRVQSTKAKHAKQVSRANHPKRAALDRLAALKAAVDAKEQKEASEAADKEANEQKEGKNRRKRPDATDPDLIKAIEAEQEAKASLAAVQQQLATLHQVRDLSTEEEADKLDKVAALKASKQNRMPTPLSTPPPSPPRSPRKAVRIFVPFCVALRCVAWCVVWRLA